MKTLLVLAFLILTAVGYTQEYEVTGYVTDFETEEGLSGATIFVEGDSFQVTSDYEGYFFLRIPYSDGDKVLCVRRKGYRCHLVKVGEIINQFVEAPLVSLETEITEEVLWANSMESQDQASKYRTNHVRRCQVCARPKGQANH
jgi:hypothetical protein